MLTFFENVNIPSVPIDIKIYIQMVVTFGDGTLANVYCCRSLKLFLFRCFFISDLLHRYGWCNYIASVDIVIANTNIQLLSNLLTLIISTLNALRHDARFERILIRGAIDSDERLFLLFCILKNFDARRAIFKKTFSSLSFFISWMNKFRYNYVHHIGVDARKKHRLVDRTNKVVIPCRHLACYRSQIM